MGLIRAVAQVLAPQAVLDMIANMPDRQRLESDYLHHAVTGELHWWLRRHATAAARFRRATRVHHERRATNLRLTYSVCTAQNWPMTGAFYAVLLFICATNVISSKWRRTG